MAAASYRPRAMPAVHSDRASSSGSASTIFAGAVEGYHVLKIAGYSRTKAAFPNGKGIESRPFRVGGHTWHLWYCPNGRIQIMCPCASSSMTLLACKAVEAQATFSLLDTKGNIDSSNRITTKVVNYLETRGWGYSRFITRESLENPKYLKDDCFRVIVVPPSNMHRDFGDLLLSKVGVDVKFKVDKKKFGAHRSVLAARSPVFKADLYGRMRKSTTKSAIKDDDMEEEVFKLMLTFIYTDALPEVKQQGEATMAQHLLVAVDRYNLERLKLMCEDKLSKNIDVGTVANLLALAEQYCCHDLKEACL